MRSLGQEIYEGEIRAWPVRGSQFSACDYCPYPDVCGFNPGQGAFEYHDLLKMEPDEVFNKMREDE